MTWLLLAHPIDTKRVLQHARTPHLLASGGDRSLAPKQEAGEQEGPRQNLNVRLRTTKSTQNITDIQTSGIRTFSKYLGQYPHKKSNRQFMNIQMCIQKIQRIQKGERSHRADTLSCGTFIPIRFHVELSLRYTFM